MLKRKKRKSPSTTAQETFPLVKTIRCVTNFWLKSYLKKWSIITIFIYKYIDYNLYYYDNFRIPVAEPRSTTKDVIRAHPLFNDGMKAKSQFYDLHMKP